jgi:3-oxoacyl-[acyl-carrier-protein] synthase-3
MAETNSPAPAAGRSFGAGVQALAYTLGRRRETRDDLLRDNPDWRMDDVEAKTGVRVRHIADGETAADMAVTAAEALFAQGVDRAGIDALVFVTQSPDYFLPTTACLLQHRLGLRKQCAAFDVNQGCSGFVYGLALATSLIETGMAHQVLLLCGDTYNRYIQPADRSCRPIFSDGAAAAVIAPGGGASVTGFAFGSDGAGGQNLIVAGGAARGPSTPAHLHMDGPQVLMFTMAAVPKLVTQMLADAGLSLDDIDLFVFHQASALVLDNIGRRLNIPSDKLYRNLEPIGNTVSASIPIALADASREGRLKPGHRVLLCGFGVGYSWAGAIVRWADPVVGASD